MQIQVYLFEEDERRNEDEFDDGIGGAVVRAFYSPIRELLISNNVHEVGAVRK
jgi:hypothetical protein